MAEAERLRWENGRCKLADLRPQEDNPRHIDKDSVKRLRTSWDDYGQVDPLAVGPDGSIYNGHQRYFVLLDRHGPDYEVDVRVASRSLSRREWQRLTVLLHEGAVGEWDFDGLANWDGVDVGDLVDWGFDPVSLGIEDWGKEEPLADPGAQIDKAAELQEKWGTALGQLWEVGRHRIVCGDCTDAAVVEAVMQGEKAGAVITDPPYGLGDSKSFNDDHPEFDDNATTDLSKLDLSVPYVIWGGQYYDWLPDKRNKIGWIVWDKRPDLEGDKRERADRIFGQHFEIAITDIGPLRGKMYRQRWGGYYGSQEIWHKTQKPPELFGWCIEPTDGIIIDYFLGSGTTIIACEQLGRIGRGIEICEKYVAVTLERLSQMGLEPTLVGTI